MILAPESADDYSLSYEHGGPTQVRLTLYADFEKNRIDVLPYNFRASSQNPDAVGVPTNAGLLQSHGVELFVKRGGFALTANLNHTLTSSVDQFAYNDLNPAAIFGGTPLSGRLRTGLHGDALLRVRADAAAAHYAAALVRERVPLRQRNESLDHKLEDRRARAGPQR